MNSENRLYVGNLSDETSAAALKRRFAECGAVSEVEIATDRASGRMRGFAFVTMATPEDARSAITQLNGSMFEDRQLRVSEAGEERPEGGGRGSRKETVKKVRITSQFRERFNMAYEIECDGTKLAFKIFPTPTETGGEEWRMEAHATGTPDSEMIKASAPTRRAAFDIIEATWRARSVAASLPELDWRAVAEALASVKAV